MSLHLKKAQKCYKQGHSTLNRKFGIGNKYKIASNSFVKAGEEYLKITDLQMAGDSFKSAAECFVQCGEKQEAIDYFQKSADAFETLYDNLEERSLSKLGEAMEPKMFDPLRTSGKLLHRAADLLAEQGKILHAAKLERKCADRFKEALEKLKRSLKTLRDRQQNQIRLKNEHEITDLEEDGEDIDLSQLKIVSDDDIDQMVHSMKEIGSEGASYFQNACDYFETNSSFESCNAVLKEKVDTFALAGLYKEAIETISSMFYLEWNQPKSTERSLLHHDANQLLFKLSIYSFLSMDSDNYLNELEEFKSQIELLETYGNNWKKTLEYDLISSIVQSFEKQDLKNFSNVISIYDKARKMNDDEVAQLLDIRRKIEASFESENLQ